MKLKSLLSLSFFLYFLLSFLHAKAQSQNYIPTIFSKTPNSAAFAKYGDYPVNLYSGLPEISIPLYTVEAGGLSLPISLSYHASGIKVDEAAGWVGAGWSLNAGGSITRNVMGGRPDDVTGYIGNFRDASTLAPTYVDGDVDYLYRTAVLNGNDTRPDIFSYNLPGNTGKFFFNAKNGYKITMVPFSPVLIKNAGAAGSALRFNLTDVHGNIFLLGNSAFETTSTYSQSSTTYIGTTAWMLEKMISQNRRDTISFAYSPQNIAAPDQTGQAVVVEDQQFYPGGQVSGCPVPYVSSQPTTITTNTSSSFSEQDIQQINFKNGKVVFKRSATSRLDMNAYPLDSMKVYNYNYGSKAFELQKSIVFYKSYYTGVNTEQGRLRLDSIQILDKAGSVTQRYRFVYNTQHVPGYLSYSKDYWGYYNAKMDNQSGTARTLVPHTGISFAQTQSTTPSTIYIGSSDSTSRNPDSNYMQAGVLKTIYFPTGGHTTFAYQTNRYLDSYSVMHLTGGLRVDTISSYDNISSTPVVKTYQYNTARANFMTAGFTGLINYGFFLHTQTARYFIGTPQNGACVTKRVRSYNSESASSLTPTEGNPVAYDVVTEYTGTPTANIGKSVYTFRDQADQWSGSAGSTGVPVILDYFYARGQLADKTDYLRKTDGTYQVVKEVNNTYTAFPQKLYADVGMVVGQVKSTEGNYTEIYASTGPSGDNDSNAYPYNDYSIVADDNYLTASTTTTYDMNDPTKFVNSSVSYGYGDTIHQQVEVITHADSKGNTRTTNTKYTYNYPAGNVIIDSMVNRHMYAEVIEKSESYTTTAGTNTTSALLYQFKNGSIVNTIVPDRISFLNLPTPVNDFSPSTVVSGSLTKDSRYTQMISFDNYDTQNNITQYTPRNAIPVSILWDYQSELPVAQVKNAVLTTVAYTSFETGGKGNWNFSGAPVNNPTAPTGNYVYSLGSGDVTSGTLDNTKSYIVSYWSNNGAATLSYAGGNVPGTPLRSANGWTYYEHVLPAGSSGTIDLYGSTSIDELRLYPANAQMSTYTYDPNGITRMADTKGSIGSFEYDFFQRLKNVKDWNGNIVKSYGYHTYDQVVANDAITATAFTRNNCPAGTSPQSTTYAIPAGKYLSLTKTAANADANYDLNTNGQIKANTVCGCPIKTISFTLSNSTGRSGYQATFSGISTPFNFPSSGSTVVQVPAGTYSTVSINPVGTFTATFTLGTRTPVNAHYASFNSVVIATGSSDSSLSIQ
ncbi:DUF5977 domain-containing protein [Mucilaginibacter sp.]|uniref:DUF5977 domain-containing protein n=1 Tax=Mucilaginibacter sp. TaxID=1882438 RepID=UPI003D0B1175